ncbi:hypothetical protein H310_06416 [Aphanomyces invadans]|uniref:Uncharacterized protein n=1 Tax=Aphanomyces invadans TaxID=157072 RepID=A0A024U6K8_9STRA|nr:hypothetical protein H310_06416 [Aphanomyces invadans]ETW01845.1 hypothetical protein H310_06416 [Aphanomyces invadans]|eukprot:XP_008869693.1 hypothetical protein H310_06416 [Aphanomyces invadans]
MAGGSNSNGTTALVLPRQYSARLFRSSWLTAFSVYSAAQCDLWMCCTMTLLVLFTSLNYWQHPVRGWRRNVDISAVVLGFAYHLYQSLWCASWSHQILYYAFVVKTVYCYSQARAAPNKDVSSRWHMIMHLVGNIGNLILYAGGLNV